MGDLLKDMSLHREVEEEGNESSLFSPIHIGETDTQILEKEDTECTGDSKKETPFLKAISGSRFQKSFSRKESF